MIGRFASIIESAKKIIKNNRPMSLNEWAEAHGYLSAESSADVGAWKSIPYQVGILNAISDENIEGVVVKKSARVGYTKILTHSIGYFIEHKPSPILIVQPTIEDAEGFSKEELAPYLRDVKCLTNLVSDSKSKDGTNSILHKLFPGGVLSIIGANSPRGFRRISRRIILLDEVSGYPKSAGPEGSPVKLAIRRSEYFFDRKILAGSTPTIKEECEISRMFDETDQRYFFVPCPHCGHYQYLKFKNLKWPDEDPSLAFFECEKNKCKIEHKHKRSMVERGEWRSTAESKKSKWVGFHIWAAYSYSPNSNWGHIANEFLEAKRQGLEHIKTFVNTVLGQEFDDNFFERNNVYELSARAESYALGTAPEKVVYVTMGVDVQDNRLAIKRVGWCNDDECYILDYQEIYGNPAESAIWRSLDKIREAPIPHPVYKEIPVSATFVDSGGHFTSEVYSYCRDRKDKFVFAAKGSSQKNRPPINKPSLVDINFRGKILKRGALLYILGVDTIKSSIYARLKITEPGAKYIHFPVGLGDDYFKGLNSEKKISKFKKTGLRVVEWIKINDRNEPLDTFVLAVAANELFKKQFPKNLAVSVVEERLKLNLQKKSKTMKEAKDTSAPTLRGKNFVNSW